MSATDPAPDPETHRQRAQSFGAVAGLYDRARPGYPEPAIDWLLGDAPARHVLEIGAGTGKLTRQLARREITLTAVEPSDGMLATLRELLPDVRALNASAERIPLPDASVDVVIGAQMWHWVDPEAASREVARLLAAGGHLALVWNIRDADVDWVNQMSEIVGEHRALDPTRPPVKAPLCRCEYASFAWSQTLDRAALKELAASRSYMIVASPEHRAATFAALDELLDSHPQLAGRERFELPYITHCTRWYRD